jgi:hypothetical protein
VPTPRGPIDASWARTSGGFRLAFAAPTAGDVLVPLYGRARAVRLDGRPARGERRGDYLRLSGLRGRHVVTWSG